MASLLPPQPIANKYRQTAWDEDHPHRPQNVPPPANHHMSDCPSPGIAPHDNRERRTPVGSPISKRRTETPADAQARRSRARELASHASPLNRFNFPPPNFNSHHDTSESGSQIQNNIPDGLTADDFDNLDSERSALRELAETMESDEFALLRQNLFVTNGRIPCMEGVNSDASAREKFKGISNEEWDEPCPNYTTDDNQFGSCRKIIETCIFGPDCANFSGCSRYLSRLHERPRVPQLEGASSIGELLETPYATKSTSYSLEGEDGDRAYWVCQDHLDGNLESFDHEVVLNSHLFGTCARHKRKLQEKYPEGRSTCECRQILQQKLCRFDYRILQTWFIERFIYRVSKSSGAWGGVDRSWTQPGNPNTYPAVAQRKYRYLQPGLKLSTGPQGSLETFRQHVYRNHPCGLGCGRRREQQNSVRDCRACGGFVVAPSAPANDDEGRTRQAARKVQRALGLDGAAARRVLAELREDHEEDLQGVRVRRLRGRTVYRRHVPSPQSSVATQDLPGVSEMSAGSLMSNLLPRATRDALQRRRRRRERQRDLERRVERRRAEQDESSDEEAS